MQIYYKDWMDTKLGPVEVVAHGDACVFIRNDSKPNILKAIPYLLITASIIQEDEALPHVHDFVLKTEEITAVDYSLLKLVQTIN